MTETINEQLKKLISKFNSIQGSLLSMGKRLTALEEKKPSEAPDNELLIKVATYLGFIKKEVEPSEGKEELITGELTKITAGDEVLYDKYAEEEIDPEIKEALDEIIEAE